MKNSSDKEPIEVLPPKYSPLRDPEHRRWLFPRILLGAGLFFWALLITFLFLGFPVGGRVGEIINNISGTVPWLRPAGHWVMLQAYASLISPDSWNWMVSGQTWMNIAIGAAGLLVMMTAGRLFVSCFETYIPRSAEIALDFVMGIGVCGVVYTFVAFAGLLFQWLALIILLILFLALTYAARRARRRINMRVATVTQSLDRYYVIQRKLALEREEQTWMHPQGVIQRFLAGTMLFLIGLITALTFFHGIFFPEVYWDSLILYLGTARGIFLQHAFPLKVVGQVGVGLGANYPHIYELTGATIATWANHWSPIYLQLASPLAGLLTIILIYHIALRLTRSVLLALTTTLLVRSVPYLITYDVYASNYSFVVLFAVAFFYCALRYVEDGLPAYLALAAFCAAFSVHINYLMWSLWACWFLLVVVAHWPRRPMVPRVRPQDFSPVDLTEEIEPSQFTHVQEWPGLLEVLRSRVFISTLIWAGLASAVWYVRNWIVTGNPVYAFFTGIFGGKHINPDVMKSATIEWQRHGDGIGVMGARSLESHRAEAGLFL